MQAVSRYGFFKGALLALWRLLRCNPFGKGGIDPVK
jgi:putative component of membrane protein insertase Oxa1/YidC/SpoIIIJ protein YidD